MKIAVIGSGVAGLSVAVRLACQGHEVEVYEKNNQIGGKISLLTKDGFTWDGGPSFFTDPDELRRLYSHAGRTMSDYFRFFELNEACRYFVDGQIMKGYDTPRALARELERVYGEPRSNTLRFMEDMVTLYDSVGTTFLNKPFSLKNAMSPKSAIDVLTTSPRTVIGTMSSTTDHYFETLGAKVFFNRFATYVGADPRRAPGLLCTTAVLEHHQGAFQPEGGMRSIVEGIKKLAIEMGVKFVVNSPVSSLIVDGGGAKGLVVNGKKILCDAVVNAADVAQIYQAHDKDRLAKHSQREHSASAVVLYLGVRTFSSDIYLHNIFFAQDYHQELDYLWNKKLPYKDPTIYLNNTSYFEKTHAPKHHQNWFVMINAPAGATETYVHKARGFMVDKLSREFRKDLSQYIVTEQMTLTPRFLERTYGAFKGSIYGLAANSWQGMAFRPKNKDPKIASLYHCGVTAHPGGGIPLALRSAKIVAELIG